MYQITLEALAKALDFEFYGDKSAIPMSVTIDSRLVQKGDLFIAFRGEKVDGHCFIDSAINNGACGVVCEALPKNLKENVGYIIAKGSIFLERLGKWMRERFEGRVIAITGSYGKTSTKDLLYTILSNKYQTVVTYENQNNELGLPLTLSKLTEDTEMLIVEMGMTAIGDIDYLAKLAKPHYAIITSIGEVHSEHLGGKHNIAKAKAEVISHLSDASSLSIRKSDLEWLKPYLKAYQGELIMADETCFASDITLSDSGTTFTYNEGNEALTIAFENLGEHYVFNAILAISIARRLNVSLDEIKYALENQQVHSSNRMEKIVLEKNVILYNDCYNANPDSMIATLKVLALHKPRKTIAILGDMYELGEFEKSGHYRVGTMASELQIDTLITVGALAEMIAKGAVEGKGLRVAYRCATNKEVISIIEKVYEKDAVILIKGSRGMHMEEIVNALKEQYSGGQ